MHLVKLCSIYLFKFYILRLVIFHFINWQNIMRFRSLRRLFAHDFAPQKSPESFITASCYISCANSEIIVFNYFNSNSIFKLEKKIV